MLSPGTGKLVTGLTVGPRPGGAIDCVALRSPWGRQSAGEARQRAWVNVRNACHAPTSTTTDQRSRRIARSASHVRHSQPQPRDPRFGAIAADVDEPLVFREASRFGLIRSINPHASLRIGPEFGTSLSWGPFVEH